MLILKYSALCLLMLLAPELRANDLPPDSLSTGNQQTPKPVQAEIQPTATNADEDTSFFTMLDQPQQYIAAGFLGFSKSVDEFFSSEKAEYENNGSFIRLTADSIFTEGEGWGFTGSTRARLVLPNTRNKMRLVFESDPNQERESEQPSLQNNPLEVAEKKDYFAGLEALVGEFELWRFRPGLGIKLNRSLDLYWRFRASRNFDISTLWQGYFGNTLYHFSSTGYRFDSKFELNRRSGDHGLLRSQTSAKREQAEDWWQLSQVFSFTHSIDGKQALVYLAGVYGINEPDTHAEEYLLQIRYRRLLHSNYLFGEIIPQFQYLLENNFEPGFSLTLRMEMVFRQ